MTARRCLAAALLTLLPWVASAQTPPPSYGVPPIPDYVRRALDDPGRTDAMRARDAGRRPAEVFALAGIKPGDKVIEFASFGQYDTTLIASIVGPRGHVWMYDLPYLQARAEAPSRAFVAAHKNTEYQIGKFDELTLPKNVDLVVFDMYYHDLQPNKVDTAKLNRMVYDALKPGGRVLVVDHRAEPGSGWRDAATIHRMDTATIVQEMEAAGFRLAVNSALFSNPADDKSKRVFEPTIRGGTDRSLFVFVKPR